MESFEALGLDPLVVEALACEGIEKPTSLQEQAIPLLRRGSSVVLRAAPGAGLLVTYGAPLLDRLEPEGGQPAAIILKPEREQVKSRALSLARMALGTGHRVGALGVPWFGAERSDVLIATPDDLYGAIRSAELKTDQVACLVVDGAAAMVEGIAGKERLNAILEAVKGEGLQIAVVSDPISAGVRQWVEEHVRRAVFLPPEAATGESPLTPIQRGTLRAYTVEDDIDLSLPLLISQELEGECQYALVFVHSEDRAADVGDLLALHGFDVGHPGDTEANVWLGVDPLEARAAVADLAKTASIAVISADVAADADELDRRHGGSGGTVMIRPHEFPHLRRVAQDSGYTIEPMATPVSVSEGEGSAFIAGVEAAMEEEDLVPYLALLEPLIRRRGAAEVAATLAALLRRTRRGQKPSGGRLDSPDRLGDPRITKRPPPWARLFLSVGRRDGVAAGDLLGAIAGETGIAGSQVGRIDVKDGFSRVEVHDAVADRVIRTLNGTSIRGRSIRVDYDRGETRAQGGSSPRKGVRKRGHPEGRKK